MKLRIWNVLVQVWKKMNRLMVEHGLKEPELSEEGDYFVVKFFGPCDKILDLVSDIPDERKTDLKELGLNDRQIDALRLMVNDNKVLTNKIYQEMFKVSRNTASRHLNEMVELNQIQKIGKGRYTKYKAN